MKKQCNLYLSERAIQMANEIAQYETLPRAAIFEEAIRRYHKSFKQRQVIDAAGGEGAPVKLTAPADWQAEQ